MFGKQFKFRRTTIITVGLTAFLLGLGFARLKVPLSDELIAVSLLVFLVTIFRMKFPALLGLILFGFVLGWWRGQVFLQRLEPLQAIAGQRIVAIVNVDTDAVYDDRKELSFDASNIHLLEPYDEYLTGKIAVAGFGEPAIYKGDVVKIEGKVYESRGSKQLRMSFADLEVLGRSGTFIDDTRRKFAAGIETALPEPLASFGLGLLIGQRNTLPDEITLQLSAVGLTHIIAVSGYNLTIIMRAVRRMLHKRSKYQTTILSLSLMGTFLLMTGFSASIVRASIVSGLSLLAWYYGRTFKPVLLIFLVAALTAGVNPLYIWSDIGWYLSFLAFFGVLVLAPLIGRRLFKTKKPKALTVLMIESLSALVMTAPLVLYIFQKISLVALIANLMIVPLVPVAMLLALIAGLGGMFLPIISGLIAWPARILMTYMLDIVQLISRIPHALVSRELTLGFMLYLYGCICVFVLILWRKTDNKNDILTTRTSGESSNVWT